MVKELAQIWQHKKENLFKNDNYRTSHEDERALHYGLRTIGAMTLRQKKEELESKSSYGQ